MNTCNCKVPQKHIVVIDMAYDDEYELQGISDHNDEYNHSDYILMPTMVSKDAYRYPSSIDECYSSNNNPFYMAKVQEMPKPKTEEDPHSNEANAPKYPDATEEPEIPESYNESYEWPTTGMAGPIAEEHWNSEMTGLENNDPSSTLHDQMTSEEVYEWLQEPSDQVVW